MPLCRRIFFLFVFLALLASCTAFQGEFAPLATEPLSSEPRTVSVEPWSFSDRPGLAVQTSHFHLFTTIADQVY